MEKRTVFARLLVAYLVAFGAGACANRGMQERKKDSGSDATDAIAEAPEDHATNCTARFSFEDGTVQGATINTANTNAKAFTMISNSGAVTLCGSGALEIDATFMGSSGTDAGPNPYVAGEVDIPLNGTEDLSGKTLTVNARVVPARAISFFVILTTNSLGYSTVPGSPISLAKDQWYTLSYTFPGVNSSSGDGGTDDGGDGGPRDGSSDGPRDSGPVDSGPLDGSVSGMTSVYGLALEAFLYNADAATNYKIYVDEIDIR